MAGGKLHISRNAKFKAISACSVFLLLAFVSLSALFFPWLEWTGKTKPNAVATVSGRQEDMRDQQPQLQSHRVLPHDRSLASIQKVRDTVTASTLVGPLNGHDVNTGHVGVEALAAAGTSGGHQGTWTRDSNGGADVMTRGSEGWRVVAGTTSNARERDDGSERERDDGSERESDDGSERERDDGSERESDDGSERERDDGSERDRESERGHNHGSDDDITGDGDGVVEMTGDKHSRRVSDMSGADDRGTDGSSGGERGERRSASDWQVNEEEARRVRRGEAREFLRNPGRDRDSEQSLPLTPEKHAAANTLSI